MIKKLFTLIFLILRGVKRFLLWLIHLDPKKIAAFLLLVAVIVVAARYFIKTVPDYSRPGGYAYVSRSDYARYQKGYCLKEDRILSDEELFRRAILQYMRKEYEFQMKVYWYLENMDWTSSASKPQYYIYKNLTLNKYKKIFSVERTHREYIDLIREFFMKESQKIEAKDIAKYLEIDLKTKTAGFIYPIALDLPEHGFDMYIDKSFLLSIKKDKVNLRFYFRTNTIYQFHGPFFDYTFKSYKDELKKHLNNILKYNEIIDIKIDNCGNIDFDVEKRYQEYEPTIGKAG